MFVTDFDLEEEEKHGMLTFVYPFRNQAKR